MKKLFKSIFSKQKTSELRSLDDPRNLARGDMIVLKEDYGLPTMLRGKEFQVSHVGTYQFQYRHYSECTLKGDGPSIFLSIDEIDGEEMANFSLKIEREQVEQLFDMDEFADIFAVASPNDAETNEGETGSAILHLKNTPTTLSGWVSDLYRQQDFGERGYYYDRSFGSMGPPKTKGQGEPFEYYSLLSDDERYGIEIEVWEDGATDVFLSLYRPMTDIVELFPAHKD